jgi:hypothetical protein
MRLIASQTLGSAAASVTFSNIPQGYSALLLKGSVRNAAASTIQLRFNGDTGSNYSVLILQGSGSAASSGTLTSLSIWRVPIDSETADTFGSGEALIPNYSGSTQKSVSAVGVAEANIAGAWMRVAAGLWTGTAAITSVEARPGSGDISAGSSFQLYGLY